MNKILEEKLEILSGDELLLEAIRAVFDKQIELEKPNVDTHDNNQKIGEKYRAYVKAQEILNAVMADIKTYKSQKNNSKSFNKAK